MTGSIPHRISEIKEIFSGIKENINAQRTSRPRKNSILVEVCTPGSCGYDGCRESARNRELELLGRIDELESLVGKSRAVGDEGGGTEELALENAKLVSELERMRQETEDAVRKKDEETRMMKREVARISSMNEILRRDNVEMDRVLGEYKNDVERLRGIEEEYARQRGIAGQLREELMDLKGSIRILCRIRPRMEDGGVVEMKSSDETVEIQDGNRRYSFLFDKVFEASATQQCVYREISPTVQSVLDGYKVCVFAYGQTGSGKTYTMEGEDGKDGMIASAVREIYGAADGMRVCGWEFVGTCTYVEIYNEEVVDLFGGETRKISMVHEDGDMHLTNCTTQQIQGADEALGVFREAACRRRTGGTNCNSRSSRSHSIYTLRMTMENRSLGQRREGVACFVDLAGSERLGNSGAEGIRLRETQNINRSLSALGDVFNAILRKDGHIPFRNSKLTYMLQGFLSGNSRAVMLVNVSSDRSHLNETICSLRFADRVGQCKLGPVRRQVTNMVSR